MTPFGFGSSPTVPISIGKALRMAEHHRGMAAAYLSMAVQTGREDLFEAARNAEQLATDYEQVVADKRRAR